MNVSLMEQRWTLDDDTSWSALARAADRDVPTSSDASIDAATDEALVSAAAELGTGLPRHVEMALIEFADHPNRNGALLLTDVPVGALPATPAAPHLPTGKDLDTELTLLAVARRLGQPVGYAPEHGGRIVQNIVPVQASADLQMSTSSRSNLMFHTETAFHPHRPRYLALFCLRGNAEAHTTMASVFDIVAELPDSMVAAMFEPRFRTAVDASFRTAAGDANDAPTSDLPTHSLLSGTLAEPTFVFDADLTTGTDPEAVDVVAAIIEAIGQVQTSVVLTPGDLLVIDNNLAVHGRSPFTASFDGTDRWLQRAFIVSDLAPSAADRCGRVITTHFA